MDDFSGRYRLIDRLAYQIGDREKAIKILQARGHLAEDGKTLTPAGEKRNAMTAEERAVDREARRRGVDSSRLAYDPQTNRATLKGKPAIKGW